MEPTGSPVRPRRADVLVDAAFLVLVALAVRVPSFWVSIIDPDEGIFGVAAREIVWGSLPYVTFFDIKPVGSTLMLAGVMKLFGVNLVAIRALGLICVVASAILLRTLAGRLGLDRAAALSAALLYIAFSTTMHGLATMTEILLAPFTIASVLLIHGTLATQGAGRRLLLGLFAGLACGCAILIKIVPALPCAVALGTVALYALIARRFRPTEGVALGIAFGVGAAVPMAVTAATFLASGHFPEFYVSNFQAYGSYLDSGISWKDIVRTGLDVSAVLWPLLVFSLIAMADLVQRFFSRREISLLDLLIIAWMAAEFTAATAPMHFFHHYYLMTLPPLCIATVMGIRLAAKWVGAQVNRATIAAAALVTLVPVLPMMAVNVPAVAASDLSREASDTIVRASRGPRPTLLVTSFEFANLYWMTGAPLPSRFALPHVLVGPEERLVAADMPSELRRVMATKPEFIIVDRHIPLLSDWAAAEVEPVLAQSYRLLARPWDYAPLDVGVARRHDLHIYQRIAEPGVVEVR